jgi:hypothetical protein
VYLPAAGASRAAPGSGGFHTVGFAVFMHPTVGKSANRGYHPYGGFTIAVKSQRAAAKKEPTRALDSGYRPDS